MRNLFTVDYSIRLQITWRWTFNPSQTDGIDDFFSGVFSSFCCNTHAQMLQRNNLTKPLLFQRCLHLLIIRESSAVNCQHVAATILIPRNIYGCNFIFKWCVFYIYWKVKSENMSFHFRFKSVRTQGLFNLILSNKLRIKRSFFYSTIRNTTFILHIWTQRTVRIVWNLTDVQFSVNIFDPRVQYWNVFTSMLFLHAMVQKIL